MDGSGHRHLRHWTLTTYTHGLSGPLTITEKVTSSVNRTTTIAYNSQGRPATITDPRGKTTTLSYDGTTADLVSVADPLTHATTFGYDGYGRRVAVTDALSHSTTTSYDDSGRVTSYTPRREAATAYGNERTSSDPLEGLSP